MADESPVKRKRISSQELAKFLVRERVPPDGLEIKIINDEIGRGVFTTRSYGKGDYLCEYEGHLTEKCSANDDTYMYEFKYNGRYMWIDASEENGTFGRLVNDEHKRPNANMKLLTVDGSPHLCLFATMDIAEGTEIRYDYGPGFYPWRNKISKRRGPAAKIPKRQMTDACFGGQQRKKWVFVTSALKTDNEKVQVNLFAEKLGCRVDDEFSKSTTHVIIKSCESDDHKAPSTLKYMQAVASKIWLVSIRWVEECLKANTILSEETFEIFGDEDTDEYHRGPQRSRMAFLRLFSKTEFYCHGHYEGIKIEQLHGLIQMSGGKILLNRNEYSSTKETLKFFLIDNEKNIPGPDIVKKDLEKLLTDGEKKIGIKVQRLAWLTTSLVNFKMEPLEDTPDSSFVMTKRTSGRKMSHKDPGFEFLVREREMDELLGFVSECDDYADDPADTDYNGDKDVEDCENDSSEDDTGSERISSHQKQPIYLAHQTEGEVADNDVSSYLEEDTGSESIQSQTCFSNKQQGEIEAKVRKGDVDISSAATMTLDETVNTKSTLNSAFNRTCRCHVDGTPPQIAVQAKSTATGIRDWTKSHHCFICGKDVKKISKHLEQHVADPQVSEALSKPKGSKERKTLLKKLRNYGDYKRNINVLKSGGQMIVQRRPADDTTERKYDEYGCCPHCYGFYLERDLWRHSKICSVKFQEKDSVTCLNIKRTSQQIISMATGRTQSKFHDFILSKMNKDDIYFIVKNDTFLNLYGQTLLDTVGMERKEEISNKIRNLGRLLQVLRSSTNKCSAKMETFIDPAFFDTIVDSTKELAGYTSNEQGIHIRTPSLLLRIGYSLKALGVILRGKAIKENKQELISKSRNFLELMDSEWTILSTNAQKLLQENRDDVPEKPPLTEDVKKLSNFCQQEIKTLCERADCHKTLNEDDWRSLNVYLLCRVTSFNARRGGECAKLPIHVWMRAEERQWIQEEDYELIIDETEKLLAKRLNVCYISGKRRKKVPIILPPDVTRGIRITMQYRAIAGVFNTNKFVFATQKSENGHIRGWDSVKHCAHKCGARYPELLTCTKIRKYLATVIQLLDMTDPELRWVTEHLGHSMDVHKKWYRLKDTTVELTKVARVLCAAEQGTIKANLKPSSLQIKAPSTGLTPVKSDLQKDIQVIKKAKDTHSSTCSSSGSKDKDQAPIAEEKKSRKKWTKEEKDALIAAFQTCFLAERVPRKKECLDAMRKFPLLAGRSWRNLVFQVKNMLVTKKLKKTSFVTK